jgi:plastocyanin
MRASLLLTLPLALGLAACGGSSGSTAGDSGNPGRVKVTASDRACDLATTSLQPGKVTFDVQNEGNDVTEVYVYAKGGGGDFDKIVGEVENIAPGTGRAFPVTVASGTTYEVACKPGQTGNGIRTKVIVAGTASAATTEVAVAYDREVEVTAKEYSFTGLATLRGKVGEKIEFKLTNAGSLPHELEIFGPDGTKLGEVGPTEAGKVGEVVLTLATAGTYTYESGIGTDAAKGMKGSFVVA